MQIAMSHERLRQLLLSQLSHNFLLDEGEEARIEDALPETLDRSFRCFSHSLNKYYTRDGKTWFNPYHSAQYGIFLYFLSNTLWKKMPGCLCDKVYCLHKMLSAADIFYQVELPDVFFTDHPVGTVLGRAVYGRFFSFAQNCTVGNNWERYPILGENVSMLSYSRVIGGSRVGNNVILASGTFVKDQDVPDNCMVFGQSPNLVFKHREAGFFQGHFQR